MTVKTLSHIHELLKEEEKRCAGAYKIAHEAYYKAAEEDAPNTKTLDEMQKKMRRKHTEARLALEEFEAKEW